jgi:hypothetical protein
MSLPPSPIAGLRPVAAPQADLAAAAPPSGRAPDALPRVEPAACPEGARRPDPRPVATLPVVPRPAEAAEVGRLRERAEAERQSPGGAAPPEPPWLALDVLDRRL